MKINGETKVGLSKGFKIEQPENGCFTTEHFLDAKVERGEKYDIIRARDEMENDQLVYSVTLRYAMTCCNRLELLKDTDCNDAMGHHNTDIDWCSVVFRFDLPDNN